MTAIAQQGAACAQVLATAELLEAILLHVDSSRTILISQRVDSTFRACIKRSSKIQERLFLRPSASKPRLSEDNPLIFCNARELTGYTRHLIPSSTLYGLGLNELEYRSGDTTFGVEHIDIQCWEESSKNATASFLDMYIRRGPENTIRLKVDNSFFGPPQTWYATSVKVKPQVFRDLVTLAARLQELAEYVTNHRNVENTCSQWDGDDPNDRMDGTEWRNFFTMAQKEMIASEPRVYFM